jgi:hypothetical protein
MLNFNDLLSKHGFNPEHVLILRHRPREPQLRKVLPWLAAEKHNVFNAYQQSQGKPLENSMQKLVGKGYVAAFIGQKPGEAVFVDLYSIKSSKPLSFEEFWQIPENKELKKFGLGGQEKNAFRAPVLWFNLMPLNFYSEWMGKLVIKWPPPELSWWRRAHNNVFPVISIHEESVFVPNMLKWDEINFTWEELSIIPTRLRYALSEWRGIYYIFDTTDSKGYVGSAYGNDNILGRWLNYAASGHGGNKLLKNRDPRSFRFSILRLVAQDVEPSKMIQIENSWKLRLNTRKPYGLNEN